MSFFGTATSSSFASFNARIVSVVIAARLAAVFRRPLFPVVLEHNSPPHSLLAARPVDHLLGHDRLPEDRELGVGHPRVDGLRRPLQLVEHLVADPVAGGAQQRVRHVDVDRVRVVQHLPDVGEGREDAPLLLVQLPLHVLVERARVGQDLDRLRREVAAPGQVHLLPDVHVGAVQVPVEAGVAVAELPRPLHTRLEVVALLRLPRLLPSFGARAAVIAAVAVVVSRRLEQPLLRRDVLDTVDEEVRVGRAPRERDELHDGDEARKVVDLDLRVSAVRDAGEVEQLRAVVDLRPEAVLEPLLGLLLLLGGRDEVEVREDAHHPREPVCLQDVQELERLHLEAVRRVREQQHQVRDLGDVDHRAQVVGALEERETSVLPRDDSDGTVHCL